MHSPQSNNTSVMSSARKLVAPNTTRDFRRLDQRISIKEQRMEAWFQLTSDRDTPLNIGNDKRQVEALKQFLNSVKQPYRQRCIDKIEDIASPSLETLERNGLNVRRLVRLEQHPEIDKELKDLMLKRYWLDEGMRPEFSSIWNLSNGELQRHPYLEDSFFANSDAAHNYSGALKFMCMTDPDINQIISKIPLPEDTPERKAKREQLEELSRFTFGNSTLTHSNKHGFNGNTIITQRMWNDLGFGGVLPDGGRTKRLPEDLNQPLLQWNTIEDVFNLDRQGDPRAQKVVDALQNAARINGFHVVGDFFDPCGKDLLGLDDRVFWTLDTQGATYYGNKQVRVPIKDIPNAVVCLSDSVMVNMATKMESVPEYANGLISVSQFQELVIDHATILPDGKVNFSVPHSQFLINDPRIEIQTLGPFSF